MKIDSEKIDSVSERDVDRTSVEGKASAVQFVHFNFTKKQVKKFKESNCEIIIGIDHKEYSHTTKLSKNNIRALSEDFS